MLLPECSDLLMGDYMGDIEDPQTLQIQFNEMMRDNTFVIPVLQVAHFQHEYIFNKAKGEALNCGFQSSVVCRPDSCLDQVANTRHLRTLTSVNP